MKGVDLSSFQRVDACWKTERFAEHATKLALVTSKRSGAPNVNYDLEIRRELLWLRRKLNELAGTLEPFNGSSVEFYYGSDER